MYRKNLRRGFTLIELAAVAIIIAILSSIAVSQLSSSTSYTAKARLIAFVEQLNSAQSVYLAETLQPEVKPVDAAVDSATDTHTAACLAYLKLKSYLPAMQAYTSLDDFETAVYEKINATSKFTVIYEKNTASGRYVFKTEPKTK